MNATSLPTTSNVVQRSNGSVTSTQTQQPPTLPSSKQNEFATSSSISETDSMDHEKESTQNLQFAEATRRNLKYLLPSTYVRRLIRGRFYRGCCTGAAVFWFVIGVLVMRKTEHATRAVRYIKTHGGSVALESIEQSEAFANLIDTLDREFERPPAFFLLNQYALNMTFNFLCNTQEYPGAHDRFIFVTLDHVAKETLEKYWPNVRQFYWPTPSLYKPFSFAEGPYQTIYLLRANLAISLLKRGKSFWMMQQDTFWRRNLFDLRLEDDHSFDALFDQIGKDEQSQRAEWVNGANFYIHANNYTLEFFEAVAAKLAHWYAPDMGLMIHQCHTWNRPRCQYISHKIGHSWEWMYTDQKDPPYILQLDCETDGGSKLQQLARFGFYFTHEDGRTCNPEAVKLARKRMDEGKVEVTDPSLFRLSWGRFQFRLYWWLVDHILMTPIIGPLLKPYLPMLGFCLMISL
ncbi:Nucleotid-trans domain-containing protein [Aphelenchoides besseyi]|nr:Nucleotid-trans domain-containing protein [Aphelenchoides besseyi]KAI6194459.1 Nucleotid-trans domain-containing protein [Aphelenchoides besseyi]